MDESMRMIIGAMITVGGIEKVIGFAPKSVEIDMKEIEKIMKKDVEENEADAH